jgi:pseudouridine-5'-phosphate glycosidase
VSAVTDLLELSEEVGDALADGRPVVALETTLVAHGFPPPDGLEVGLAAEASVRSVGAVPATVGIVDGRICIGLDAGQLERFSADARKVGPRDVAACVRQEATGATTVGGTLVLVARAGIRFLGTGGIGGVHRGFAERPDVSADVPTLARTQALVVSSGAKSILDVAATMEVLETEGVPVLGFRTDTLPLFYEAEGGPPVPARVEDAAEAASIAEAHWSLGGGGILVGNPPPESLDVEKLVQEGLERARLEGVSGQEVTPFLLAFLHEGSGGRTRDVNRTLILENARLAAEISVAFAAR